MLRMYYADAREEFNLQVRDTYGHVVADAATACINSAWHDFVDQDGKVSPTVFPSVLRQAHTLYRVCIDKRN